MKPSLYAFFFVISLLGCGPKETCPPGVLPEVWKPYADLIPSEGVICGPTKPSTPYELQVGFRTNQEQALKALQLRLGASGWAEAGPPNFTTYLGFFDKRNSLIEAETDRLTVSVGTKYGTSAVLRLSSSACNFGKTGPICSLDGKHLVFCEGIVLTKVVEECPNGCRSMTSVCQ